MKKIGLIMAIAFFAACNNSGTGTNATDSSGVNDNTNMYDTGAGSSMTDSVQHRDTSLMPNKMQDTGSKK